MSLGLANVIVDGAGNRTFCCCSPMTKTIINSTDWDYSIDSTNLNAKIIKDCWRTGQDLIGSSAGCIHQGQTPNPSYTQTVHTTVTRTFASNVSAASVSFVGGGLYIFSTTDLFDDVGKIGSIHITDIPDIGCSTNVLVILPLDITSELTIVNNIVSFTMSAQDICCTQNGYKALRFLWDVTLV